MMHSKARLFGDAEAAAQILEAWSPREAKRVGRAVRGFDAAAWDREKMRIVRRGTWCKFTHALPEDAAEASEEEDSKTKKDPPAVEGADEVAEKRKTAGDGASPAGQEEMASVKEGVEQEMTWYLGTDGQASTVQAASFREALLRTGDRELVEVSPFDRIWGIGFGAANAERNRARWGQNLLGQALMEVRDEFRRELEKKGEDGENLVEPDSN
jgi:predicted NAD-dependent protein-ADP-ribosyltransferase YbiA (DUF1768 family)